MKLNEDRHFYLYAKNWYKQTDLMQDLKTIYSKVYGVETEHIDLNDLLAVLTNLVQFHLMQKAHRFRELVENILPENTWKIGYKHNKANMYGQANIQNAPEYDVRIALLHAHISILHSTLKVEFPFELGTPDFTILPEKDKRTF